MTAAGPTAIIEFFEQRPTLTTEMRRLHVDDGTGHCKGCSWQTVPPRWPCLICHYIGYARSRLGL